MDWKSEIRAALRDAVKEQLLDAAVQCTVKSVDKAAGLLVATGLRDGTDYHNVRVAAAPDAGGVGLLVWPVVGSAITVAHLDGLDTMAFVAQVSEVEAYELVLANGVSLRLTPAGHLELNGTAHGGLVQVAQLTAKLAQLEAAVNVLKTQMATHTHVLVTPTVPPAPFPAAVALPAAALATAPLVPTQRTELENSLVQHG